MDHILLGELYELKIGPTLYKYIDTPIETHYFYKNNKEDVGAWIGKSNLALYNDNNPNKHFEDVEDAFRKMRGYQKDDKYLCGLIINYKTKIYYYNDYDLCKKYWTNQLDKIIYLAEGKKVDNWDNVPI
jgi:hypothetical protein